MINTIILLILATGLGIYHDTNKPTEYEINMEDGTNTHVVLQKNSKYACPIYCDVSHVHHAVVCKDDKQIDKNKTVYHISKSDENGISLYCSTKRILSMTRFVPNTAKDKLPDVISASKDE